MCEFPPPHVTPCPPAAGAAGALPAPARPEPPLRGMVGPGEQDQAHAAPKAQRMLGAGELLSQHPLLPYIPTSWGGVAASTLHPSKYTDLPLRYSHPGAAACRL